MHGVGILDFKSFFLLFVRKALELPERKRPTSGYLIDEFIKKTNMYPNDEHPDTG